jgi:hypothetical protein
MHMQHAHMVSTLFPFLFLCFFSRSTGVAFVGRRLRKSATIPFRKRSPVPGPRVPNSGFLGFWDGWARRLLPVLAFSGMRGRPGSREVNEEIWPCLRERPDARDLVTQA